MRRALAVLLALGGVGHAKPAAKPVETAAAFVGGHLKMTVPAGWQVIPAGGKARSGKGGRGVYVAATCVGTIVIVEQWDDAEPDKGLAKAIQSIAFDPDGGSMFVQKGDIDKLAPAAHQVAERAARAVCLGGTTMFVGDAADAVDVDGTATSGKAIAEAANKAGDLATWLRTTTGMWEVVVDPDDANHFVVERVPTKALGEAEQMTALLYELHGGAWKLIKIKRASAP